MKKQLKIVSTALAMTVILFGIFDPNVGEGRDLPLLGERIKLIKTQENSTVYFIDVDNVRHAFPNREIYKSWYGNDFSKVVTVSKEYLGSLDLGQNVTWKPGKALLKVPSNPVVYAVEPGGTLRAIKDEETAKTIFGNEWYHRVRTLSELFFQNYHIGRPIVNEQDVPDGYVVVDSLSSRASEASREIPQGSGYNEISPIHRTGGVSRNDDNKDVNYYIKWRGVLQKFESQQALRKNGYVPEDALSTLPKYFSTRVREIKGKEDRIVDPMFISNISSLTCDLSNLRIGMVVVANRALTKDEFGVLQDAVAKLPQYYEQATEGLGRAEAENNVLIMEFQSIFDDPIQKNINFEEVARTYYDFHPDDIDFIAIFNTVYQHEGNEIARYIPVTNSIKGTGKLIYNRANQFGSLGRLKGIFDMGEIEQYTGAVGDGPNLTLSTLVHEMMHSVSGSMSFLDESGFPKDLLLGYEDPFHWSRFMREPSLLGGDGWILENADSRGLNADFRGIYKTAVSSNPEFQRRFSDLDLYAFGFIPARSVLPIEYLEVDDWQNPAHRLEGVVKTVSIDQIIQLNGKRECILDT